MKDEVKRLVTAVRSGDVEYVRKVLSARPDLTNSTEAGFTCLEAASTCDTFKNGRGVEMIETLVQLGCDVNQYNTLMRSTPLSNAVNQDNVEAVWVLLSHGADPNVLRPLIAAIVGGKANALAMVKLLDKHGADLSQEFRIGSTDEFKTAYDFARDWGRADVCEYLASRGAAVTARSGSKKKTRWDEVCAFCERVFGTLHPLSLTEVVPTGPSFRIHAIFPTTDKGCTTLFTAGLSDHRMEMPSPELAAYQFAELFIQLPGRWQLDDKALRDPQWTWPVVWLKKMTRQLMSGDCSLAGPVAIWSASEGSETLAPHLKFTAFLLLAEMSHGFSNGEQLALFRVTPLYPEEVQLEKREGVAALMRAFDRHSTPFIVDGDRENVAV
ncbi:MAG: suppressor of fused domain protein [Bryobacteraceae bacterium]|nr:suppressor of fused domain protein [Bryobacteraceae bacterium]